MYVRDGPGAVLAGDGSGLREAKGEDKRADSRWCSVCELQVPRRDHHCIWLDVGIGAANHRWFLLSLLLFCVSGAYGAHLTLTTVCTPTMHLDWFLWLSDCRFVYQDLPNALSFVSALYTVGVVTVVLAFVTIPQCLVISHGVIPEELPRGFSGVGALLFKWTKPTRILSNCACFYSDREVDVIFR